MVIQMDETIGVKGGKNDRRRQMVLTKEARKKLEQYEEERELAELERKVKKKQLFTLIKTLPTAIGGGTIQTLYDVAVGKKREDKEEENSKWKIKEYDSDHSSRTPEEEEQKRRKIITTPTGEKIVVYVVTPMEEKKTISSTPVSLDAPPKVLEEKKDKQEVETPTPVPFVEAKKEPKTESPKPQEERFIFTEPAPQKDAPKKETPAPIHVGIGQDQIDITSFIQDELSTIDFEQLPPKAKETLERLKSHKIVEEYERQLKDIRYELRKVIYEYDVLVEDNEEVVLSRDAEVILDRLSEIIDRVEELKRKIRIDHLDQYDDNYIHHLIEGYLEDFHHGKAIDEVKDSPLYLMLEEKLAELDQKKGKFQKSVDQKKEELVLKEEDFEKLKSRYYSLDQFNNQLLQFQTQQDAFLKEIREKIQNATSESERIVEEVQGLNLQSRRLLRLLSFQMFLPGPRFAKGLAASAASYLFFMNQVVRPHTVTKKYRVITVHDYHQDIQDSLHSLQDASHLLSKTSEQIDKMIGELKNRYHDYLGVVPECDDLLRNLKKMKSEVEEKEYEMERLKKQQELELEKNDAKVKTIGEYPVN